MASLTAVLFEVLDMYVSCVVFWMYCHTYRDVCSYIDNIGIKFHASFLHLCSLRDSVLKASLQCTDLILTCIRYIFCFNGFSE